MEIELTRLALSVLAGYFLSVSGSLSQLTTQNNLASPSTLGFDGVVVLNILVAHGLIYFFDLSISLEHLSFSFFLVLITLLFLIFKKRMTNSKKPSDKIILMGLGINLFIGALFSIVQFLFMSVQVEFPQGLWFGNFKYSNTNFLYIFISVLIVTLLGLKKVSKELSLIAIGHEFARSFKVNIGKFQFYSLGLSLLLTGVVISYFGVFSFLGLIFPHILRSFSLFKYDIKKELYIGAPICGLALGLLDQACYHLDFYGTELPVGMISSVGGAFLLLILLIKSDLFRQEK